MPRRCKKPADLSLLQLKTHGLVINLKICVPPLLLPRVDEVIEQGCQLFAVRAARGARRSSALVTTIVAALFRNFDISRYVNA